MPLASGTRLGRYEVLTPLGAGGMGEVYRGLDPGLGRQVAIKVLPSDFSADSDRLRRFEQEARAAAALSHPNILAVYDIGQHDGAPYIVSELLEGATLRERLLEGPAQRPLPPRKALDYAMQIACGLAAAHEKGIAHRDLKPENLFVTSDGRVKILDFGLAKLLQPSATSSDSPTAARGTEAGAVLGTVGYMSPEQVRGQPADHRSDIFAFGAILYELVSGRRAFQEESAAETMAAILKEDPPGLGAADPHLPPTLARIVERCLEKDPKERFQSAHDLGFALEGLSTSSDAATPLIPSTRPWSRWLSWALAAATALALIAASIPLITNLQGDSKADRAVQFLIAPPGRVSVSGSQRTIAVSPDGNYLVFVATTGDGTPILWLRALDSLQAQPLPGTEGARNPFWSWDSRFIGFEAFGKMRKIAVTGGFPQTVADAPPAPRTSSWGRGGVILVSSESEGIRRVSDAGGTLTSVSAPERSRQEDAHLFPHFLPDGRRFLFCIRSSNPENDGIYLRALDSDEVRLVVRARSNMAYVAPGYIVYARVGVLLAQQFDAERGETKGEPFTIADNVLQLPDTGLAAFSASEAGVLAYQAPVAVSSRLLWRDRQGNQAGSIGEPGAYRNPRLSPDGKRVAVEIVDASGNLDLWLIDVARGVPTKFTFDAGRDSAPVWSADGKSIAWQGNAHMYRKATNDGPEESLKDEPWIPDDSIPDGTALLCHPPTPRQIWLLPLAGADRAPRAIVEGRGVVTHARVSPDGKWLAFASNNSGRFEVYLKDLSTPAEPQQLSPEGGIQPKWRNDGKEIFYLALDGTLMAVPVTLGPLVEVGRPSPLFETRVEATTGVFWHQYDVARDGRFLVNTPEGVTAPLTVVVVNWPALVEQ